MFGGKRVLKAFEMANVYRSKKYRNDLVPLYIDFIILSTF